MHNNSRLLFEKYAKPFFFPGAKVLEIGPDAFPSTYRNCLDVADMTWHTLDIFDSPQLTYPKSPLYDFPIPDGSYDIILSGNVIEHVARHIEVPRGVAAGNVIEHVARIWRWMPELARVTKPGGFVITINPVSWPFHEVPIDCWRIYPDGMKALSEDSGLVLENSVCECLEKPFVRKVYGGMSAEFQGPKERLFSRLLGPLGFPIQKAYDTVTIARKPALPQS